MREELKSNVTGSRPILEKKCKLYSRMRKAYRIGWRWDEQRWDVQWVGLEKKF